MNVRPLKASDIPALNRMAEASGFPYPDLFHVEHIEAILVLADDDDQPIMAAAAKRIAEMYLWCGSLSSPLAKVHGLRLLHEAMSEKLRNLGYTDANGFLPPSLAKRFARRLERTFGWKPNWPSWVKEL